MINKMFGLRAGISDDAVKKWTIGFGLFIPTAWLGYSQVNIDFATSANQFFNQYYHRLSINLKIGKSASVRKDYVDAETISALSDMAAHLDSLDAALKEAISHAKGNKNAVRIAEPKQVDVQKLRSSIGLTQGQFATIFGISLGTLRHWEQGTRTPRGPALILLNVIKQEPRAVLKALGVNK